MIHYRERIPATLHVNGEPVECRIGFGFPTRDERPPQVVIQLPDGTDVDITVDELRMWVEVLDSGETGTDRA